MVWGLPVAAVDRDADLTYCELRPPGFSGVWVPFRDEYYRPETVCTIRTEGPDLEWGEKSGPLDPLGSIYRLLSLKDEFSIANRDRNAMGVFNLEAIAPARRQAAEILLVERAIRQLGRRIEEKRPSLWAARIPLWPDDKKYACVLTHDTDALDVFHPNEMLVNLSKWLLKRNKHSREMFLFAMRDRKPTPENPLYGFRAWPDLEQAWMTPSCFYIFVRPKPIPFSLHDCRSTVQNCQIDWPRLKELVQKGWEIGVHAPIHAKQSATWLRSCREILQERLGSEVRGLRHHYFALNWRNPTDTFRKHVEAGYAYDSSIAWRDGLGFRSGTSLPYRPFDDEANSPLALIELPMSIMDKHILRNETDDLEKAVLQANSVIQEIKNHHGVVNLNWHTETGPGAFMYANFPKLLRRIFLPLVEDREAWITTPTQLAKHWREREKRLQNAEIPQKIWNEPRGRIESPAFAP